MAMKVNYGLERAERNRAKQAKKDAKAKAKQSQRAADAAAAADARPLETGAPRAAGTEEPDV